MEFFGRLEDGVEGDEKAWHYGRPSPGVTASQDPGETVGDRVRSRTRKVKMTPQYLEKTGRTIHASKSRLITRSDPKRDKSLVISVALHGSVRFGGLEPGLS